MIEFNSEGSVANAPAVLAARGFKVGCKLERCADGVQFTLSSIPSSEQAIITDSAGVAISVRISSLCKGNFKACKDEAKTQYSDCAEPSGSMPWKLEIAASKLKLAMDKVNKEHMETLQSCKIATAPTKARGVYAGGAHNSGELVLVPFSPKIAYRKPSEKAKGSQVDTNIFLQDGGARGNAPKMQVLMGCRSGDMQTCTRC
jgi:hypothetical protein